MYKFQNNPKVNIHSGVDQEYLSKPMLSSPYAQPEQYRREDLSSNARDPYEGMTSLKYQQLLDNHHPHISEQVPPVSIPFYSRDRNLPDLEEHQQYNKWGLQDHARNDPPIYPSYGNEDFRGGRDGLPNYDANSAPSLHNVSDGRTAKGVNSNDTAHNFGIPNGNGMGGILPEGYGGGLSNYYDVNQGLQMQRADEANTKTQLLSDNMSRKELMNMNPQEKYEMIKKKNGNKGSYNFLTGQ